MNLSPAFFPDVNIWVNALNASAADHRVCRLWLDEVTSSGGILLVNDLTECALLRISSHRQLGIANSEIAMDFHKALLDYPNTQRISPSERHREILHSLIRTLSLSGNDINDAWLAALAIESGATLISLDQGFSRFPKLSWFNPAMHSQTIENP
jgi:toxin-antitoxin system PIN domain toxin